MATSSIAGVSEAQLVAWAQAPGSTEQARCENAERMICDAINEDASLAARNIRVFAQGSYRNRTNVRQDSDVDICVLCTDYCWTSYTFAPGLTDSDVGLSDSSYTYARFKDDVGRALVAKFGQSHVQRGNKAFDIHANSYRVDADVVACFEFRQYQRDDAGGVRYDSGTAFFPDSGMRVVNWPDQHYDNGVRKNDASNRSFKAVARILKNLRNEMADANILAAGPIPSFLLECIAYNTPNHVLMSRTWTETLKGTLANAFHALKEEPSCAEWVEVNELKYLMRGGQPWTREDSLTFVAAAWSFAGF